MNRLRNAGVIWIVACALTLFLPGRSVWAAVLMYDGFDYTLGASLTNQAGGTGWGAATNYWKGTVTEGVNSNSTIVAGLTFSDYQVAGNAVQLCASNAIVIRYGRKIQTGAVGDIWMSYLYRPDVNRGQYNFSAIQCNNSWNAAGGEYMRNICQVYNPGGVAGTAGKGGVKATVTDNNSSSNYPSLATYMLIAHFQNVTNAITVNIKTGTWWAVSAANYDAIKTNPTEDALNANCVSKAAETTGTNAEAFINARFIQISEAQYSASAYKETFDELRYATTLADLFPFISGPVFLVR